MPNPANVSPCPPPLSGATEDPASLVDLAASIKESIAEMTEDLRRINQVLAEKAAFKPGSKTGHLAGRHFAAKVSLRENVKWDQDVLANVRQAMGDAEFFRVFKWEFKPASEKVLAGALEFGQHGHLIAAARTITEGAPQVSFEKLESC